MITIKFLENKNGKWRQSATHAKMARGEMVRFAAKEGINRPEDLKEFSDFGYVFQQQIPQRKIIYLRNCRKREIRRFLFFYIN